MKISLFSYLKFIKVMPYESQPVRLFTKVHTRINISGSYNISNNFFIKTQYYLEIFNHKQIINVTQFLLKSWFYLKNIINSKFYWKFDFFIVFTKNWSFWNLVKFRKKNCWFGYLFAKIKKLKNFVNDGV